MEQTDTSCSDSTGQIYADKERWREHDCKSCECRVWNKIVLIRATVLFSKKLKVEYFSLMRERLPYSMQVIVHYILE